MPVTSVLMLIADMDDERFTIVGPTSDIESVRHRVEHKQVAGRHVRCEPVPSHLTREQAIAEYERLHPDMHFDDAIAA